MPDLAAAISAPRMLNAERFTTSCARTRSPGLLPSPETVTVFGQACPPRLCPLRSQSRLASPLSLAQFLLLGLLRPLNTAFPRSIPSVHFFLARAPATRRRSRPLICYCVTASGHVSNTPPVGTSLRLAR